MAPAFCIHKMTPNWKAWKGQIQMTVLSWRSGFHTATKKLYSLQVDSEEEKVVPWSLEPGRLIRNPAFTHKWRENSPVTVLHQTVCHILGRITGCYTNTWTSQVAHAPRAPAPAAGHCWPAPPQEILNHSKTGQTQSLWGLWILVHSRFCLVPLSISGRYGVWF